MEVKADRDVTWPTAIPLYSNLYWNERDLKDLSFKASLEVNPGEGSEEEDMEESRHQMPLVSLAPLYCLQFVRGHAARDIMNTFLEAGK